MGHPDDSSLNPASLVTASTSHQAYSQWLHEEFEAYYAERERRRLNAEARARRTVFWRADDHVLEQVWPDR